MILQKGKSHTILEYRSAYLAPAGTKENESAFEYEQFLHNSGILVDHYDRSDLRTASRKHIASTINGMLFQFIWINESRDVYNLGSIQDCERINIDITEEEKKCPDFFNLTTNKTVELKMTQCNSYEIKNDKLYKRGKLVKPGLVHNSDIVIVCVLNENSIEEFYCYKCKWCYKISYRVISKRLQKIKYIFDTLKVK